MIYTHILSLTASDQVILSVCNCERVDEVGDGKRRGAQDPADLGYINKVPSLPATIVGPELQLGRPTKCLDLNGPRPSDRLGNSSHTAPQDAEGAPSF
jgi:hypothetical protein